jgi:DNA primase
MPHFVSFNTLKKIIPISAVLNNKGLLDKFKMRGEQLVGPCPIHGGDNPNAFVVNLNKNLWYCFTGCNAGGDIVDLVCRLEGFNFKQTFLFLTSLAGKDNSRFLLPLSSHKKFNLFPHKLRLDHNTLWLKSKKIAPKTAAFFETGAYHGKGFLADSIGLRLHDLYGAPIGYAARRLSHEKIKLYGKWQFPPKLPKNSLLYNYHRLKPQDDSIVITECPWGIMRLYQLNIPAVALLGIQMSNTQYRLLQNFKNIILSVFPVGLYS